MKARHHLRSQEHSKLTIDEARRWLTVGMERAETEDGAVAALMALLMGMRVSEIADRIVRNLDDNGRLLWITDRSRRLSATKRGPTPSRPLNSRAR